MPMKNPTDERLAELTDKLENGIKELYASGKYAEYLHAMSKFHRYSFGNALLILFQCPTATRVAGYTTWKKDFGRNVKRNEKGIQILAPCPSRRYVWKEVTDPNTGKVLCNPDGSPRRETQLVTVTHFKVATVFDVSQTEGKELPTLGVTRLTGNVENFAAIYDKLTSLSPVPVEIDICPGEANGYFSSMENRIVLRPGMSQIQTVKTLVHEIAHAKLHDAKNIPPEERKQRREKEVEAESIAYVVCQHFGIDTSEYSFGYVAGWSRGKEMNELKSSLDQIHSTAGEIIAALDDTCMVHTQVKSKPTPQFAR